MNGLKGNKPTNVIFFLAFTYPPIYTLHKMDWICWFVEILLLYLDHIYCCSCNLCSCSWFAKMVSPWALSAVLWRGTTLDYLALLLLPLAICKCCIPEVKKLTLCTWQRQIWWSFDEMVHIDYSVLIYLTFLHFITVIC